MAPSLAESILAEPRHLEELQRLLAFLEEDRARQIGSRLTCKEYEYIQSHGNEPAREAKHMHKLINRDREGGASS